MDKIVAEEDILLFIDDALNTVGAFGYGTGEREKKSVKIKNKDLHWKL